METASAQEVKAASAYGKVADYWNRLLPLFGKKKLYSQIPHIAIYSLPVMSDSIYVYPQDTRSVDQHGLVLIILHGQKGMDKTFSYLNSHCIVVPESKLDTTEAKFALGEETTHAMCNFPYGSFNVLKAELTGLSISLRKTVGEAARKVISNSKGKYIRVNMNEFFPPLGNTLLFGQEYLDYAWQELDHDWSENENLSQVFLDHLPQIATLHLLAEFKGDVEKLLKKHPDIITADADTLWKNYCLPYLNPKRLKLPAFGSVRALLTSAAKIVKKFD
ncbi:hypothetical protein HY214_00375 [Candidatus Roizmanbacteria bacterium]|nr:hypothetical protein [Candidatus Roizmanbacteria bacterium]